MSLETLNCPKCGAPLPDPAGRATVTCAHCHTVVRVGSPAAASAPLVPPPNLRAAKVKQFAAEDLAQIRSLIERGNKIGAIKHYRERTGVGLKEAKDAVEAIGRGQDPPLVPAAYATPLAPASVDLPQIRELLKANKKIEAIKLYRGATGLGLKEAKDAVDAIERGDEPPVVAMARARHNVPAGVDLAQIQAALRAGRKIEAIKLYRSYTGLGLKEAKDAVEAIAASTPGVTPSTAAGDNRGCVYILLAVLALVVCLFAGCGTYAQTTAAYRCAVGEVKQDLGASGLLGEEVNAGYLVLAPGFSQSFDLDGSWRQSMDLYMPAWGSRGLGWLFLGTRADDSGYTAVRATLFADWQRHVLRTWEQVECG